MLEFGVPRADVERLIDKYARFLRLDGAEAAALLAAVDDFAARHAAAHVAAPAPAPELPPRVAPVPELPSQHRAGAVTAAGDSPADDARGTGSPAADG